MTRFFRTFMDGFLVLVKLQIQHVMLRNKYNNESRLSREKYYMLLILFAKLKILYDKSAIFVRKSKDNKGIGINICKTS